MLLSFYIYIFMIQAVVSLDSGWPHRRPGDIAWGLWEKAAKCRGIYAPHTEQSWAELMFVFEKMFSAQNVF